MERDDRSRSSLLLGIPIDPSLIRIFSCRSFDLSAGADVCFSRSALWIILPTFFPPAALRSFRVSLRALSSCWELAAWPGRKGHSIFRAALFFHRHLSLVSESGFPAWRV